MELKVATWNVRRANIYNGRFGEIVKECIERGWDIVCVSELNARVDGIIVNKRNWFGNSGTLRNMLLFSSFLIT